MSQLNRRRKQAARLGVSLVRRQVHPELGTANGYWDVVIESEAPFGLRGVIRRKRDAVNFAYRIAKSASLR